VLRGGKGLELLGVGVEKIAALKLCDTNPVTGKRLQEMKKHKAASRNIYICVCVCVCVCVWTFLIDTKNCVI